MYLKHVFRDIPHNFTLKNAPSYGTMILKPEACAPRILSCRSDYAISFQATESDQHIGYILIVGVY